MFRPLEFLTPVCEIGYAGKARGKGTALNDN